MVGRFCQENILDQSIVSSDSAAEWFNEHRKEKYFGMDFLWWTSSLLNVPLNIG